MQNTAKQNYPGSVASYDIRSGDETGLFYNGPRGHYPGKQHRWSKYSADLHSGASL